MILDIIEIQILIKTCIIIITMQIVGMVKMYQSSENFCQLKCFQLFATLLLCSCYWNKA